MEYKKKMSKDIKKENIKPNKPSLPPNRPIQTGNKFMGAAFAKMLAEKMKAGPPPQARAKPAKPVEIEKGLDYDEVIEAKPKMKSGRKPAKKTFEIDED